MVGAAHASRITVLFKVAKLLTEFRRRTCLGTQFRGVVSITVERAQWNSWQWEQVGGALHILEDQEKGRGVVVPALRPLSPFPPLFQSSWGPVSPLFRVDLLSLVKPLWKLASIH